MTVSSTPDSVVWWTAFGAIAQALGALATFAAVTVSLWVVLSERSMRGRASSGIRVMFAGDGTPGIYMVAIETLNTGLRPFQVTSVGWRTGWLSRGPKSLRYRFAIQNTSMMLHQRPGPHIVEPGRNEAFYSRVSDMKQHGRGDAGDEMFRHKMRFLGDAPIWAMVNITGRKPLYARVSDELALFLRTNQHASTTDDEPAEA